jgi:hypothetical protein
LIPRCVEAINNLVRDRQKLVDGPEESVVVVRIIGPQLGHPGAQGSPAIDQYGQVGQIDRVRQHGRVGRLRGDLHGRRLIEEPRPGTGPGARIRRSCRVNKTERRTGSASTIRSQPADPHPRVVPGNSLPGRYVTTYRKIGIWLQRHHRILPGVGDRRRSAPSCAASNSLRPASAGWCSAEATWPASPGRVRPAT